MENGCLSSLMLVISSKQGYRKRQCEKQQKIRVVVGFVIETSGMFLLDFLTVSWLIRPVYYGFWTDPRDS